MPERIRNALRNPNTWLILLTGLYLVILATRVSETFFGPDSWQWHGRPPAPSTYGRWWPALLLLGGFVAVTLFWMDGDGADRPARRREWLALAFLVLMAPAIQVALKYIHVATPVEYYLHRTIGPHNGFWQVAGAADSLGQFLRTYPAQMQAHPFVHTPVHPPGNFVYIWLWRRVLQAWPALAHPLAQFFRTYNCTDLRFVTMSDAQIGSALAQVIIPALSGLAAIPLYFFGKRVAGPRAGFRAAALFVIVPSFTLFTMRWDQFYPIFWALAFLLFHLGLEKGQLFWFFLAGIPVSVASFMSFGNLTILPLLGLYALAHLAMTGVGRWQAWLRRFWPGGVLFFVGAFSVWGLYQLVYGVSFLDVFGTAMETHFFLGRSYWVWLGYNLYDFVTFVGIPVAVVVVMAGVRTWARAIPRLRRQAPAGSWATVPILAFSLALLLLDLSGVSLGEVGRMWLPWMSMACVVAAVWLTRRDTRASYKLVLVLLAVQTLSFTLFLRVSATGMPDYAPRTPQLAPPAVSQPLDATLGERIRLVGYDVAPLAPRPGDTLTLTLYWQALEQPAQPYTVFAHLVGPDGQLRAQQDNMPVGDSLPTTCWQPGEYVTDSYQLTVPPDAPAGAYTLRAGMYYLPTGERLPVAGAAQPADFVTLTTVRVGEP